MCLLPSLIAAQAPLTPTDAPAQNPVLLFVCDVGYRCAATATVTVTTAVTVAVNVGITVGINVGIGGIWGPKGSQNDRPRSCLGVVWRHSATDPSSGHKGHSTP